MMIKFRKKIELILIAIGIIVAIFMFISQYLVNEVVTINVSPESEDSPYYISEPILLDQPSVGKQAEFKNAIFTYEGSTEVNGNQCNANNVNSTYHDYNATEMKSFKILVNGHVHNMNLCWPPPYTGPFEDYPTYDHVNGTGIQTSELSCPTIYAWTDVDKSAGIRISLTEGQWHTTSGKIYKLYCNGGISYLVKK